MAYGPFNANVIQIGTEGAGTPGTAVAATTVWRGPAASIIDDSLPTIIDAQAGVIAPVLESYSARKLARLTFPEVDVTFQQFGHVLAAGIQDAAAAGLGPYTWTYTMPTTTDAAIRTKTLESGNVIAGDGAEMEYSFVESFTLRGAAEEAWRIQSQWMGRQRTATTLTGSLSIPTTETILFGKNLLYIDDGGGTIGTTQVQGVLKQFTLNVTTGIQPVFTGDGGELYFYTHKRTGWAATYSMQIELENTSSRLATERTAFANQTVRLVRLRTSGSGDNQLTINFAAKHTAIGDYENQNGNTVVTLEGVIGYSSADSQSLVIVVQGAVNTWPL